MRARELIFAAVGATLLAAYLVFGSRLYASVGPGTAPSPLPTVPRVDVAAPRLPGTLAFVIQGDVFVMREGRYRHETSEGRNEQPSLSADGSVLVFSRRGQIDGRRALGTGEIVNAQLGYTDIVSKPSSGGAETLVVEGLRQRDARGGFHQVTWHFSPAFSPDGRQLAYLVEVGTSSDLVVMDVATKRVTFLSRGADLADLAWSPDGRTIATTSYNLDTPGLLLWTADRVGVARRVESLPSGEAYRPSYSADGRWLTYTLRRDGRNDVHAVEIATGRDVTLTDGGRSWGGVFSPDGAWLAFLREQGGVIDLFGMELADALSGGLAKAPVRLTQGEGIDGASRPAWSR
jgi:Tol biopolymer transport system component